MRGKPREWANAMTETPMCLMGAIVDTHPSVRQTHFPLDQHKFYSLSNVRYQPPKNGHGCSQWLILSHLGQSSAVKSSVNSHPVTNSPTPGAPCAITLRPTFTRWTTSPPRQWESGNELGTQRGGRADRDVPLMSADDFTNDKQTESNTS
ncbi:hypothetical protein D3C78_942980 [compost metagenome]